MSKEWDEIMYFHIGKFNDTNFSKMAKRYKLEKLLENKEYIVYKWESNHYYVGIRFKSLDSVLLWVIDKLEYPPKWYRYIPSVNNWYSWREGMHRERYSDYKDKINNIFKSEELLDIFMVEML